MKKLTLILLTSIVVLAGVLRFYSLGSTPPSLNWDEASLGYNAFSISQTGRDEHGVFSPIAYFAAFGDYKPPVYIYLAVPAIKLFGLNEWTVRFPSALFGTLTVLITFFLAKRLFNGNEKIALFSSFFLAISIWHINVSRAAFEANVATFFVVLGAWLFFEAVFGRIKLLPISLISFGLSLYTFNSSRVFVPLFLLALFIIYRKVLIAKFKWVAVSLVILAVLLAPLVPHLLSKEGQLRFKEVNIFSDISIVETSNERIKIDGNSWWSKIIHNRRIEYGLSFLKHYFDGYNVDYLFFRGDINPKFSTRETGQLYLFDILLIPAGLFFLIRRKEKALIPLIIWFLLAPIPAATAKETPHALRTLVLLPTYQIFSAYGFFGIFLWLEKRKQKFLKVFYALFGLFLVLDMFYYLHSYYVHYPKDYSNDWQYGYKQAVGEVAKIEKNYDKIYVSKVAGRPYIFFLLYGKVSPEYFWQYKNNVVVDDFGFYEVYGFGKYKFGDVGAAGNEKGKILIVGSEKERIAYGYNVIKTIYFLNGEVAFNIMER